MLSINLTIRKANAKDIPKIVELWKELTVEHRKKFGYDGEIFKYKKHSPSIYGKFIAKNIRSRNGQVLVGEADGIVGYVNVGINKLPKVYLHDREVFVYDLYIRKPYRRKGIGTKLMKEVEKWAREKNVFSVGLIVMPKNKAAISAYKKWGVEELYTKRAKVIHNQRE